MTGIEIIFILVFASCITLAAFGMHQASNVRRERYAKERVRNQRRKIDSLYGRNYHD